MVDAPSTLSPKDKNKAQTKRERLAKTTAAIFPLPALPSFSIHRTVESISRDAAMRYQILTTQNVSLIILPSACTTTNEYIARTTINIKGNLNRLQVDTKRPLKFWKKTLILFITYKQVIVIKT